MPEFACPFPRYDEALDVKGNTFLSGDRGDLLSCISAVRKVSDRLTISMKYSNYAKQAPRFYARESDGTSQFNAHVPLEWTGDDLKINVNAKTFSGAIEQVSGRVTIAFTNNMGKFLIKGETDDFMAVMLPVI